MVAGLAMVAAGWELPAAAERPFLTEEAETLTPTAFAFDAGIGYRDEARDFGVEPRKRQWNLGEVRLSFGLGSITELQVSGTAVAVVESLQDRQTNTNSGDWILGTKVMLTPERPKVPGLSFLYEVKLPNGSDEKGGATDETDFFGYLLSTKRLANGDQLHANVGLGILGNPFDNREQNDIYILRLAWEHHLGEQRLLGVEGIAEGGPRVEDDPVYLRLVYSQPLSRLVIYTGVGVGIGDDADRLRLSLGIRHRGQLPAPAHGSWR